MWKCHQEKKCYVQKMKKEESNLKSLDRSLKKVTPVIITSLNIKIIAINCFYLLSVGNSSIHFHIKDDINNDV